MKLFETNHQKKSVIITATILTVLMYCVLNFGLKYFDPPIEYGVAINFGNSSVGADNSRENTPKKTIEKEEVPEQTTKTPPKSVSEKPIKENIITNNQEKEAPVVKKTKKKKTTKKTVKPKKVERKPSKSTTDALQKLLSNNNSSKKTKKGQGDDTQSGVKGKTNGKPNSGNYYGSNGGNSGGNYNLAGRVALSKPIRKPNCEEEGTVVVSIFVNKNGQVFKAVPGIKGTTNSAPCLIKAAKEAALATKWNVDNKAPNKQKGTIIYKFSLSK